MEIEITHPVDQDKRDIAESLLYSVSEFIPESHVGVVHELLHTFRDACYDPDDLKKSIPKQELSVAQIRKKYNSKAPPAIRNILQRYQEEFDEYRDDIAADISPIFTRDNSSVKKAISRHGIEGLEKYWKPFTAENIQKIRDIVIDRTESFIWKTIKYPIAEFRLKQLAKRGIIKDVKDVTDHIKDAFQVSRVAEVLHRAGDLKQALKMAGERPLSSADMAGIEWARTNAGIHMRGLANASMDQIIKIASDISRTELEKQWWIERGIEDVETQLKRQIAREAVRAKVAGLDWQSFSSHLKWHWQEFTRDWDRIAFTEFGYIEKNGIAIDIMNRYGPEQKVIKIPYPDACEMCKTMYLDGNKPRVFTIGELIAYGSNGFKWKDPRDGKLKNRQFSRTRYDRKSGKFDPSSGGMVPTVGPLHPWCQCIGPIIFQEELPTVLPAYVDQNPDAKAFFEDVSKRLDAEFNKRMNKSASIFIIRNPLYKGLKDAVKRIGS